ncbi:MAG: DUF2232 domain-containing protein [Gammaproteobacteria bacterium]|nr:MAG: DUF2232 domain-containing protein [Gammaproteobacteria bacterium]RTZ72582.1 MAG: DUF2232 domain-containing protein [Gammaproteobacteria bacterium]
MKALATFIMKGRTQAVMAASVFMVLALLITPLGIFSAAVIGLVTLRHGLREGLLGMAALGFLLFGQPLALATTGALLWLPLMALAEVLRVTRSLRLVVEISVILGLLMIASQYLFMDDVAGFWKGLLSEYSAQIMDPSVITEAERNTMVEKIAPWMAGGLAAAWFLQLTLALFLARSWQAVLYHPGGFAQEFRELRLGYWLLILVPVLLLSGMLSEKPGFLAQGALVGMAAFFLQGVAVVHGLVARLKAGSGWLIGFYLLLVIGMPASFTLVSAAGFADGLVNFRARVRARDPKQGDG